MDQPVRRAEITITITIGAVTGSVVPARPTGECIRTLPDRLERREASHSILDASTVWWWRE
jgi:hypothetical protein